MFTLHHRHVVSLDQRLSAQLDRLLDLWEKASDPGGMTPEEEADLARQNNKLAAGLEGSVAAAQK